MRKYRYGGGAQSAVGGQKVGVRLRSDSTINITQEYVSNRAEGAIFLEGGYIGLGAKKEGT